MILYVVLVEYDETSWIAGIYSTRELAEENQKKLDKYDTDCATIEEETLDKPFEYIREK